MIEPLVSTRSVVFDGKEIGHIRMWGNLFCASTLDNPDSEYCSESFDGAQAVLVQQYALKQEAANGSESRVW